MAIKYCGDCDNFEPNEEGARKGYCKRIRGVVWDDDLIPTEDSSCEYYEEPEEEEE